MHDHWTYTLSTRGPVHTYAKCNFLVFPLNISLDIGYQNLSKVGTCTRRIQLLFELSSYNIWYFLSLQYIHDEMLAFHYCDICYILYYHTLASATNPGANIQTAESRSLGAMSTQTYIHTHTQFLLLMRKCDCVLLASYLRITQQPGSQNRNAVTVRHPSKFQVFPSKFHTTSQEP